MATVVAPLLVSTSAPTEAVRLAAIAGVVAPSASLSKSTAGKSLLHVPPQAVLTYGDPVDTRRTGVSPIEIVYASLPASGVATTAEPAPSLSHGPAVTVHAGQSSSAPQRGKVVVLSPRTHHFQFTADECVSEEISDV